MMMRLLPQQRLANRLSLQLPLLFLCVCLAFISPLAAYAKSYKSYEKVPVLVNNVGPVNNPAERYPYYSLPYCAPKDTSIAASSDSESSSKHSARQLGETLAGDRRRASLYDLRYNVEVQWAALCHFTLTQNDIKKFLDAIRQHYIFELFVDGLSVRGFIGESETRSTRYGGVVSGLPGLSRSGHGQITSHSHQHIHEQQEHIHNETHVYLFTHLDFSVAYNPSQATIIAVNLTTDPRQRVELEFGKDINVEFSYSVQWHATSVPFVDRQSYHARHSLLAQVDASSIEIHWLSIINSFVLVLLLTAFLAMVLMRALRKDFARYMEIEDMELAANGNGNGEEEDDELGVDEVGWKLVHGDVFRTPRYVMLLSSLLGNGFQLFILVVSILSLALMGSFVPSNRGSLYSALVVLYSITSFIGGYVSTYVYLRLGGVRWATNAVLTSLIFAGPAFGIFSIVNTVAWIHGSTSALPFQTILLLLALWSLISLPLTVFGSIRARSSFQSQGSKLFEFPTKTNRVEREVPTDIPWWRSSGILQCFIGGILPFSAIYIELFYIFSSVWGNRVYTLFGMLTLAFTMLLIVAAFISVALTYFQLASEDWRWWWRAFLQGASSGLFMLLYAAFYFLHRSNMTGVLQTTFFFGYMALVAYGFGIMIGCMTFMTSFKFVKHIYASIKVD